MSDKIRIDREKAICCKGWLVAAKGSKANPINVDRGLRLSAFSKETKLYLGTIKDKGRLFNSSHQTALSVG